MFLFIEKEYLTTTAEIFEIITPLTLFCWFFHIRWENSKDAYFRDFVGQYGAFIQETINQSTERVRYDGGLIMDIFDIDREGNFRGQFEYYENEVVLGQVGGASATERPVNSSVNFFYGKLHFRWNFRFYKRRSPILWKTNRQYKGKLITVDRLDRLTENENETLERIYGITHHRESMVIEFDECYVNKKNYDLPKHFTLLKKSNHLLDPHTNVEKIFKEAIFQRNR